LSVSASQLRLAKSRDHHSRPRPFARPFSGLIAIAVGLFAVTHYGNTSRLPPGIEILDD
jgi:hypothetical protein